MKKNSFNKSLYCYLLMAIAFALWFLSVNEVKIYRFTPDVFHYMRVLPLSYWIGLLFVLGVFSVRIIYGNNLKSTTSFDLVLILIVVLFLFGTPSFIEDTPRFLDTYGHAGSTFLVKLSGKTGPSLVEIGVPAYSYPLNYPGFFTLLATLLTVTELPWMAVLKYYPLALMAIISLFIYAIARTFNSRFSLIAPVFFLSMAWFQAFHVSPESFGLILYLAIWLCMTKLFVASKKIAVRLPLSLVIVLTVASIVTSHMVTLIFLIINLGLLSALIYKQKLVKSYMLPRNIPEILMIASLLFFAWLSYVAQFSFTFTVKSVSQAAANILTGAAPSLKPTIWSYEYTIVNRLREAEVLVTNILGVVSALLLFRNRSNRKIAVWLGGWLVSCWIFAFYCLFSQGAYIERPAMFGLIPVSVLISFCTQYIKRGYLRKAFMITCILMVSFGSLSLPLVRNANDYFETPSKSSLLAANFAVSNANTSVAYAGPNKSLLGLYSNLNLTEERHYYFFHEETSIQKYDVILFDEQAYAYALNYGYETRYQRAQDFANRILPRIYDGEAAQIYMNIFWSLNVTEQMEKP
ncbi:MAG: hypothetical protein OEZ25_07695 [Candidatus Bathyarchaeota archaeon]|nr:hypothetical protein [Candidatus Bathyarchaeota archaeon]